MLRCWSFSCTSTHTSCYAAGRFLAFPHIHHATMQDFFSHIRHATLLDVLFQFHTYIMLRCWTLSCTPIHHATLLDFLLHFHTYIMLRCWALSFTSTHTSCYAARLSLALPHIYHATLLDFLLHFHAYLLHCWTFSFTSTYIMLRCLTFSFTSTHASCYAAAARLSIALPHIHHGPLLDFLLHFHTYITLRCWTVSFTSTHLPCYAAGRFLALPHTSCDAARLFRFQEYITLRCWTFSGNVINKLGQLFAWIKENELFRRALGVQKYSFVVVKH